MLAIPDDPETKPRAVKPAAHLRRGKPTDATTAPTHRGPPDLRVTEPGPEATASWYVLTVTPGQENVAAAHLAGRGFGLYIPMRRTDWDFVPCHPTPELAGYILVSLWHDDLRRARACPGVSGVLCLANGKPVVLTEAEVLNLRRAEARNDAGLAHRYEEIEIRKKQAAEAAEHREKARKSKKKSKKEKRERKLARRKARRAAS